MSRRSAASIDEWASRVLRANGTDLLAYLARRTSSPEDAADVLGNVMIIVWKRRATIPCGDVQARMWAFGVARNALREYRRHGARRSHLAERLRANIIAKESEDGDPAEAAVHSDRARKVRTAVAALPERDRELIILIHWDEFSIAQAAEFLRIPASTARSRYARARARLSAQLDEHRLPDTITASDSSTQPRS